MSSGCWKEGQLQTVARLPGSWSDSLQRFRQVVQAQSGARNWPAVRRRGNALPKQSIRKSASVVPQPRWRFDQQLSQSRNEFQDRFFHLAMLRFSSCAGAAGLATAIFGTQFDHRCGRRPTPQHAARRRLIGSFMKALELLRQMNQQWRDVVLTSRFSGHLETTSTVGAWMVPQFRSSSARRRLDRDPRPPPQCGCWQLRLRFGSFTPSRLP